MKHPSLTVQQPKQHFLHQLCMPSPICIKWKPLCSVLKVVLIIYPLLWFLRFEYRRVPLLPVNDDARICKPIRYLEAQQEASLNLLKVQIHIQNRMFTAGANESPDLNKLAPIAQEMLRRKKSICLFDPPNLSGPVKVNLDAVTLQEDLTALAHSIDYHLEPSISAYTVQDLRKLATVEDSTDNLKSNSIPENVEVFENGASKVASKFSQLPLSLDPVPNGVHSPARCYPHRRTAIIVPYRNRKKHLMLFLRHMHSILLKQEIEYGIYIINLAGNVTFNRARLLNIGFKEALQHYDKYDCVIFHDVDLLPEDDRIIYTCGSQPKHMSVAIDSFDYKIPYEQIFGGVTGLTPWQFYMVNGYSNKYWGWGGEDDDMSARIRHKCMSILRISQDIARYRMAVHDHDKGNEVMIQRFVLLKGSLNRQPFDGLSSLEYKVVSRTYGTLYNNITVQIGRPEYEQDDLYDIMFHLAVGVLCVVILYFLLLRTRGNYEE